MVNDKNNAVDSVDTQKREFDRSICFTFFESYLEQGELVNVNLGSEVCANYFIALCRYALYQEEPQDSIIKMLITGLKNTIDAGQNKRAKSFKGEDVDMTNKILKYKEDNPNASYRQIADALGCSKSKVGKVFSNLNSNSNSNSNSNLNLNLNLNNNTMDMDVDTTTHIQKEKKERALEDLQTEELKELLKRYKKKEKYAILQKDYNLPYGSLSNELPSQIENLLIQRQKEEKNREIEAQYSSVSDIDISTVAAFLRCDKKDVLDNLCLLSVDINHMLEWIPIHGEITQKIADSDEYKEYREEQGFDTYFKVVQMMIKNNQIKNNLDNLF